MRLQQADQLVSLCFDHLITIDKFRVNVINQAGSGFVCQVAGQVKEHSPTANERFDVTREIVWDQRRDIGQKLAFATDPL